MVAVLSFLLLLSMPLASNAPTSFWDAWGDGRAELSSYKVEVSRYGELRKGYSVLVFVTEDISGKTRIKVESDRIPESERVPVLKMNRIVKFKTGIYDYSLMTSVFSGLVPVAGQSPMQPLKISFSAQEWCGQVFQMLIPQDGYADFTQHSYFEAEGDRQTRLDLPDNAKYEDNLPVWIRELYGEVMRPGEKIDALILPSMWHTRSRHTGFAFEKGWIRKEDGGSMAVLGQEEAVWRWTWHVGNRTETYWVEQDAPHRIVKWASSDGDSGELQKTVRLPYWRLHSNKDLHYRQELGLP